ncbi:transcriptional regulator SlyA (plasmid) [Martelella mediterranea DSM 17316]|uniref:Transcriptional regulator SlyA n=2 Tax=Martelella mediterranea TaxID=293089 RepID=A0A1U9ZA74_9HYPH|nr:transcriptional regulator SlyA [Martelella mediterranea DSM 17316]
MATMNDDTARKLYTLADLIHAVGRHLSVPDGLEPGPCTPVEILVMRHVLQNPGTSAREAAEAALLPSSNFSRVLRGLTEKGLLRQETDERDARGKRLYLTDRAKANFKRMQEVWSRDLSGLIEDDRQLEAVNATLRHIETRLIERRKGDASGSKGTARQTSV